MFSLGRNQSSDGSWIKQSNDWLDKEVQKLQISVSHLNEMKNALAVIKSMERVNLLELESQLNESQLILDQLEVS